MRNVPSITLNRVTTILHQSQLKYKNRIKPKRWWKLTDKIQSFRLNQKQKYSKPTGFNIPNLLPDLLPSVLDFTVGSKEYHQQQFKQCLKQIKGITILTRDPPIDMIDYLLETDFLIRYYSPNLINPYLLPIEISSKQLYPNYLFKYYPRKIGVIYN